MKKIWLLILVFLMLTATVFAETNDQPSNWAKESVNKATELGLVSERITEGYQKATSREEFATLVVILSETVLGRELEKPESKPFTDTTDGYIEKAYQAGIVKGIGGGLFAPNENVTREQIVVMYINAMNMLEDELGRELINEHLTSTFKDEGSFSFWAKDSIKIAKGNGLVKGVGNNTFDPKGLATIEQALALNLRSYYFTEDISQILSKSETYYKDVDSLGYTTEVYFSFNMEEQDTPIFMEMLMNFDTEYILEPLTMKNIIGGDMRITMLGQELIVPLDAVQYMVLDGEELLNYSTYEDVDSGERVYELFRMPYETLDMSSLSDMTSIADMNAFTQYSLVNKDVIDGKNVYTIEMVINMNEEGTNLMDELAGSMLNEVGLNSSDLGLLNGVKLTYQIDVESGKIISIEADLGEFLDVLVQESGLLKGSLEGIDIQDFRLKVEYTSINEIKEIIIPQEIIDNAIDISIE